MNFSFTRNGRAWNEDRCYACEDFVFVLDGATSLSEQKFSDKNSDAEWYSDWWYNFLKEELKDANTPIYKILQKGVDKVVEDFHALAKGKIVLDFPSCTVGIVRRIAGGKLEVYTLGDSPILMQSTTGFTVEVSDTLNNINDDINKAILKEKSLSENISLIEARKKFPECLNQGRMTKNHTWGYWILADDREAVMHGIYKIVDEKLFTKFLLMTDGYSQIYDLMEVYSKDELSARINRLEDAEAVYEELYKLQEEDTGGDKYVRFKLRDDASICVLDITK